MKRFIMIILILIVVMLFCACQRKQPVKYEAYDLSGPLSYKCPRCGYATLEVMPGKNYGICTRCDEKFFIDK